LDSITCVITFPISVCSQALFPALGLIVSCLCYPCSDGVPVLFPCLFLNKCLTPRTCFPTLALTESRSHHTKHWRVLVFRLVVTSVLGRGRWNWGCLASSSEFHALAGSRGFLAPGLARRAPIPSWASARIVRSCSPSWLVRLFRLRRIIGLPCAAGSTGVHVSALMSGSYASAVWTGNYYENYYGLQREIQT
jgi:hypothetical protein